MENIDNTRQEFIGKMIEILKNLNKFDNLNNRTKEEIAKDIQKQTEFEEKLKKEEKRKGKDGQLIKDFDFYEVATKNIIETTKNLNLFFQNKIIIEICENINQNNKCSKRSIKTQDTNILSSFDISKRFGNEFNLEDFFPINKVKIKCPKCKGENSVKAETIFSRIPEYLIILFKNNDKKINYPEENFSFEYIDYKVDNNFNFYYENKRCSYNLKALMIKENSNFNSIIINNKNDLNKYKNNPNLNIPLVLLYQKVQKDSKGSSLREDGTIIIELKGYHKNQKNINNYNIINNQSYNNNNIQDLNRTTKLYINPLINNQNNINNRISNNNNNFNNFQGNNNQNNMINNNQFYNNNQNNFYNNNNFNNNMINMNNMNNNMINNNINQNYNNQNQNQNKINYNIDGVVCLIFTFPAYNKDIYIDINENEIFENVIIELKEKYMWLNKLKDLKFVYNNKEIDGKKTVKENGLNDSNKITILFRDE